MVILDKVSDSNCEKDSKIYVHFPLHLFCAFENAEFCFIWKKRILNWEHVIEGKKILELTHF